MITFPDNPYDGQTIVDEQPDGSVVIWTYDQGKNEWTYRTYGENKHQYIYTNQVLTTTPASLSAGEEVEGGPGVLQTQEQVNDLLADTAQVLSKGTGRVSDSVDFLQNTIGKGIWKHGFQGPDLEVPAPGEFWTNANQVEFEKITTFSFNDNGVPGYTSPGSLEGTQVGDYLIVQCNNNDGFGFFVITDIQTDNKLDQIVRSFGVKVFRGTRSAGLVNINAWCTVGTARPVYTIVQDQQPVVSTRGILWYRESDDHLFISNYADGFTGEGPQWTDLTAAADGGDYLPLAGGVMKGDLSMGGHKITALDSPVQPAQAANKEYVDKFLPLKGGTMTGQLVMDGNTISGVGTPTAGGMVMSRNYADGRYLQLKEGGKIEGYVQFKEDTKLQMGGTYNNNIIDGKEGFTDNSIVATLGFVNHAVANSGVGLPHVEKMYLQGFYPWRFGEGTQVNNPGDWLAKTSDYQVVLEPANWKILYFSTTDAYGQDLAGKFLNHMDMNKLRELQLWFAREDGTKLCSYTSRGRCRDQNFENWFTVDMDASDKDLVVSPNYDTVSLEISRGEVIWIKCSAWGN